MSFWCFRIISTFLSLKTNKAGVIWSCCMLGQRSRTAGVLLMLECLLVQLSDALSRYDEQNNMCVMSISFSVKLCITQLHNFRSGFLFLPSSPFYLYSWSFRQFELWGAITGGGGIPFPSFTLCLPALPHLICCPPQSSQSNLQTNVGARPRRRAGILMWVGKY